MELDFLHNVFTLYSGGKVMRKSSSCDEWKVRVNEYRQSGLSASKWCVLNDFSVHTLKYWINRLNKLSKAHSGDDKIGEISSVGMCWASVDVADSPGSCGVCLHVGSVRIEVSSGFDKSLLSDVLQVVTRSC
jgi:hypothetical protein